MTRKKLSELIISKKAKVGVIGLGYVGLPLAVEFASVGFQVVGFEQNTKRMQEINEGKNYIADVSDEKLKQAVMSKCLMATNDLFCLKSMDAICICVPTPLDKNKQPNISFIEEVSIQIAKIIRKGQLIVLESTTYPGTTEEIILTKLTASGLKIGEDFFLAFSPERVDPGNAKFKTKNIPKVIGGVTPKCTEITKLLYSQIIEKIFTVSSPRVAEMEKLLENIFRSVNIALVNEMAILCKKMDIDIWEVIEAAKTKPYGYMPFYPGPGLGGHCIPLDPFYLSWKAKEFDMTTKFIELAGEINDRMPEYVIQLVQDALNSQRKSLKGAKVLVLGLAYKKDIDDWRESPSIKIIEGLWKRGCVVNYNDPHIPKVSIAGRLYKSLSADKQTLKEYDCVVIATDHSIYDYDLIVDSSKLVVDTRNATNKLAMKSSGKITKI